MDTIEFHSVDDFIGVYVQATQYEASAKFAQGDLLLKACEPDTLLRLGYQSQDAFLKWVADSVGRTKRTIWKRLQVSRTFAPDDRNDLVSWEGHWLCSTTNNPAYWLARAADDKLSITQLELAIKENGGDPNKGETEFVCRAADATVLMVSDNGRHVVLDMAGGIKVAQGTAVIVTMVIMGVVKAPAQVDTSALVVDIVRGEIVHAGEIAA